MRSFTLGAPGGFGKVLINAVTGKVVASRKMSDYPTYLDLTSGLSNGRVPAKVEIGEGTAVQADSVECDLDQLIRR
jgi:hypothetical protein